ALVTATRWRLGKSRRRSHRSSASGHTQLWLGIVEVLEISGGRSPLIIGDLDVYLQLPRASGAPTLNSEEPDCPTCAVQRSFRPGGPPLLVAPLYRMMSI